MVELEEQLAASLTAGHPVARATLVSGPDSGRAVLIWPAGEMLGSLGSPRLNQRIALFVEAQFTKSWSGTLRKKFHQSGTSLEVEFVVFRPQSTPS